MRYPYMFRFIFFFKEIIFNYVFESSSLLFIELPNSGTPIFLMLNYLSYFWFLPSSCFNFFFIYIYRDCIETSFYVNISRISYVSYF